MSMVDKATSKRLLAVHGWSAVILGLFLYIIVITGSVAVMSHEIGEWSVSGAGTEAPLNQPLDARIRQLAETVDPKYREDVSIFPNAAGTIQLFFHTHGTNSAGKPDDLGVRFMLAPTTLEVLQRDEGYGTELPDDQQSALDYFLSILHISLHAPDPVGLYLTGLAGFVMLAAVISGIILHKHLLRDLFVSPRLSSRLLNRRDRHILAGSWSLPFGFLLAFTGTFFSFAGAIGLPIVAMVSFGGDQVKMLETLVGVPASENKSPAVMANLDTMFAEASRRTGTKPEFASIAHWGTADAKVQVTTGPVESGIKYNNLIFHGISGQYEGVKPDLGTKPSLGNDIFGWMGPLHFGNFGGLLSKFVWVMLGLVTCYVTLTGLRLWVERRADDPVWQKLSRAIPTVGYGVPIGMAASAVGFLLSYPKGDAVAWTAGGFLAGCAVSILLGMVVSDRDRLGRMMSILLGVMLASLPFLRMAMGGAGWGDLGTTSRFVPIMLDVLFFAGGVFSIAAGLRLQVQRSRTVQLEMSEPTAVPAE
jgi:uncharacterized iron-regulated membrane protein